MRKDFVLAKDGDVVLRLPSFKNTKAPQDGTPSEDGDMYPNLPIRVTVLSATLCTASPVFKTRLTNGMAEGNELRANGHVELPCPEEDPSVIIRILHVVHDKPDSIPAGFTFRDSYSFDRLLEVAQVVDQLDFCSAMRDQATLWLDKIEDKQLPNTLDEYLLPWLWIALTFRHPALFERLVFTAQMHSTGAIDDFNAFGVPLPQRLIDGIEQRRLMAITRVHVQFLAILNVVRNDSIGLQLLTHTNTVAPGAYSDSAARLFQGLYRGYLEQEGERMGLLGDPRPADKGFRGLSIHRLSNLIHNLDPLENCALGFNVPNVRKEQLTSIDAFESHGNIESASTAGTLVDDDSEVGLQWSVNGSSGTGALPAAPSEGSLQIKALTVITEPPGAATIGQWFKSLPPGMPQWNRRKSLKVILDDMLEIIQHQEGWRLKLEHFV